jgi:hypothetical protein
LSPRPASSLDPAAHPDHPTGFFWIGHDQQAPNLNRAGLSGSRREAFGGKPGLVRAIYDRGLVGREPIPAYQRADEMRERETDPRVIMGNWATIASEVSSVVSPIERLVRAAAANDPDMAALLQAHNDRREARARHHAQFLKRRGYLREGVSLAQATDILWTCTSDELYDLLVTQRGWSLPWFERFLADFMTTVLLPQEQQATPKAGH